MMNKQQDKLGRYFENDHTVKLTSIVRNPDGSGGQNLAEILKRTDAQKIVMLANGLIRPQDIAQVYPGIESLGMKMLRLISGVRSKVSSTIDDHQGNDSIPHYFFKTSKAIHNNIFKNGFCEVIVIRNASQQDLFDAIKWGGKNSVLVVGGHGTLGSITMTDGSVKNVDIPTPDAPLKAFVQHTCANPKLGQTEEMGQRWAETTFGWKRGTSPIDFIDDPLPYRNGNFEFNIS